MSKDLWAHFKESCAWFFCNPAYPFKDPPPRERRAVPVVSSPVPTRERRAASAVSSPTPSERHATPAVPSPPEAEGDWSTTVIRFRVAQHEADVVDRSREQQISCVEDVLKTLWQPMTAKNNYDTMQTEYMRCKEIYQSSMGEDLSPFSPRKNGFVHTVLQAYNEHHELIIRPDDVWIAILSQLNLYVNANAEALREYFVTHEGRKVLILEYYGSVTRYSLDYKMVARDFSMLLRKEIVDPTFVDTILPNFSTTTMHDATICSAMMMSTLKAYFSYEVWLRCGIPAITLLGTKSDYQSILLKLDKLDEFGPEARAFTALLRPIVYEFIATFDAVSTGQEPNLDFWGRICHEESLGSGPDYLSGWLTAFCVWDRDGKWQGPNLSDGDPVTFERSALRDKESSERDEAPFAISDYGRIDMNCIPAGFSEVEVKVIEGGKRYDCMMVAGHVGARVRGRGAVKDTLQPSPQWFMFEVEEFREEGLQYA